MGVSESEVRTLKAKQARSTSSYLIQSNRVLDSVDFFKFIASIASWSWIDNTRARSQGVRVLTIFPWSPEVRGHLKHIDIVPSSIRCLFYTTAFHIILCSHVCFPLHARRCIHVGAWRSGVVLPWALSATCTDTYGKRIMFAMSTKFKSNL